MSDETAVVMEQKKANSRFAVPRYETWRGCFPGYPLTRLPFLQVDFHKNHTIIINRLKRFRIRIVFNP